VFHRKLPSESTSASYAAAMRLLPLVALVLVAGCGASSGSTTLSVQDACTSAASQGAADVRQIGQDYAHKVVDAATTAHKLATLRSNLEGRVSAYPDPVSGPFQTLADDAGRASVALEAGDDSLLSAAIDASGGAFKACNDAGAKP